MLRRTPEPTAQFEDFGIGANLSRTLSACSAHVSQLQARCGLYLGAMGNKTFTSSDVAHEAYRGSRANSGQQTLPRAGRLVHFCEVLGLDGAHSLAHGRALVRVEVWRERNGFEGGLGVALGGGGLLLLDARSLRVEWRGRGVG